MPDPGRHAPSGPAGALPEHRAGRLLRAPLTLALEPADAGGERDPRGVRPLLARIDHGPAHWRSAADPGRLVVGLPSLGPGLCEVWRSPAPVLTGWEGGIGFAAGTEVLFAHLLLPDAGETDLAELTCTAYARLLAFIRTHGFPHPLRIWNLIHRIHGRSGGLERYQAFCVGRARGLHLAGLGPADFPAASAVGSTAPGLLVYLLAGRSPGTPVENPRQVCAWRYPRQYGPRPPSFARGLRAPWTHGRSFFISGTAAVVGHRSLHPGTLAPQVDETLRNLTALLAAAAAAAPPHALKVYLRDPRALAQAQARLRDWAAPGTPVLWLQAEVCRAELAIEIEGVCGLAAHAPE